MIGAARCAAHVARLALLDALADDADRITARAAAMRVWATSDRLLAQLDADRQRRTWARTREWRAWASALLLTDTLPAPLAEIVAARRAGAYHEDQA